MPSLDAPLTPHTWYVIGVLFVVNIFNYVDRMALSVLLPLIKADLTLTDGQLGLLAGLAFSVFYAICGIPIARWADRGVRRSIIAIALATWSVMTALSGAAQNFWQLFAARVGIGAGEAGCLPPAQSIICDYVPLNRRSGAFSVHSFGLSVGMMLGMVLAGWLGESLGWRGAFVVLGLPGVLLAVVVRLTLREPKRGSLDSPTVEAPRLSLTATLVRLWSCRTYRMLMLMLVVNGFVQYGFNQWWPSFYVRTFGLGMSTVGLYLGAAIGIGSGVGLLLGGIVSNQLARRDVRFPLMFGAAAVLLALPISMASLFVASAMLSMALVGLTYLCWCVVTGPLLASIYSVTLPGMRATAGAVTIFFTSVLGFGFGPLSVGLISDALTPAFGSEALRYALVVPGSLSPIMVWLLWAAARTLPADLKAVGAGSRERLRS